jgi:hypothetical protein
LVSKVKVNQKEEKHTNAQTMQSHHLGHPFRAVGDGTSSAGVVVIVPVNEMIVKIPGTQDANASRALGVSYCFLSLPFGPLSWTLSLLNGRSGDGGGQSGGCRVKR